MNEITIGKENGKYFLIAEDGYSTTQRTYNTKEKAENARKREQKLTDDGKASRMIWKY